MAQAILQFIYRKSTKPKIAFLTSIIHKNSAVVVSEARLYGTNTADEPSSELVARQMIQYALGHARSQKSGNSYAESLRVLDHGISNLRRGDATENSLAMLMLAMSTLLYERGELQDSIEKLHMIHKLDNASLSLKVSAWEALIGLNLETGQETTSLALANDCFIRLNSSSGVPKVLKSRAKAIKGLTHLVLGELKSADELFEGCKEDLVDVRGQIGNIALNYGEFLHATGNMSLAKSLYEKVLYIHEAENVSDSSYWASSNMISEETLVGATCALGQLLSHSGKNAEAEEMLTKALTTAESYFGSNHPKVGVILMCIALMYKQRAKLEGSTTILLQEGLYRRVLDMLKAPSLDSQEFLLDPSNELEKKGIITLTIGGYSDILCIQESRREEGKRMRKWAEAAWENRRMSLAEALEISESSNLPVVDTRIYRVL